MLRNDNRSDAWFYEDAEAELNEIVEEAADWASRGRTSPRVEPRPSSRMQRPAPGTRGWTLPLRPRPSSRPRGQSDLRRLASGAAALIRLAIRGEPAITIPPLIRAEALISEIIRLLTGLAGTLPGSTARIIRSLIQRFDAERRAIMRARLGPATDFDALRTAAGRIAILAEMAVRTLSATRRAV